MSTSPSCASSSLAVLVIKRTPSRTIQTLNDLTRNPSWFLPWSAAEKPIIPALQSFILLTNDKRSTFLESYGARKLAFVWNDDEILFIVHIASIILANALHTGAATQRPCVANI